jgi:hypothetical protein
MRVSARGIVGFGALLGTACAAQSPTLEKQVAEMQDKVLILQNERDRMEERIAALEQTRRRPARQGSPNTSTRPRLKVVRVEPGGTTTPPEPEIEPASPSGGGLVAISGSGDDIVTEERSGSAGPAGPGAHGTAAIGAESPPSPVAPVRDPSSGDDLARGQQR